MSQSASDREPAAVDARRTRLMGIVNVTPDSFSDGGRFVDAGRAIDHAVALAAAGADILDIGGESTRPGHRPVPADEQIRRIGPVIAAVAERVGVPIAVDTTLASVARAAFDRGASWINDTSGFSADPELPALCAERGATVVLMHRFEPPRTSPESPPRHRAMARHIADQLAGRLELATSAGIAPTRILLDPGIGFGTLVEDALALHVFVDELRRPGAALLFGTSRKSFLGQLTGRPVDERLAASLASATILALAGVDVLRVHDVAASRDVVRVADAVRNLGEMLR